MSNLTKRSSKRTVATEWTMPPPEPSQGSPTRGEKLWEITALQTPTAREIEVLVFIAEGLTNYEIGRKMWLSEETVKSHVRHLLGKMQARNRAHLVALGYQQGLLTTG